MQEGEMPREVLVHGRGQGALLSHVFAVQVCTHLTRAGSHQQMAIGKG